MARKKSRVKLPTIKQLPSGSWTTQIQVGGKRHQITRPTEAEVLAEWSAIKTAQKQLERRPDVLTLTQAIDGYIEYKGATLSVTTLRGYRTIQRNRFPELMERDIHSLTAENVQAAVNAALGKLSPKTVKNSLALVEAVLAHYKVRFDTEVTPPTVQQKPEDLMQKDDILRLVAELEDDPYELPILMALWMGLRTSEIHGLCWDCVDLERGTATVRRGLVQDERNQWILKDTVKNSSSVRVLEMPERIQTLIGQRAKPGCSGRIITTHPETPRKHLHFLCKKLQIPDSTMHQLRHSFVALLMSLNVQTNVIQRMGGWSTPYTMQRVYSYLMTDDKRAAMNTLTAFMTGEKVQSADVGADG